MIRETLFKEKQILPVFFQIPSAVYVWTQEWCSFQMERSHFDKITSIYTPDSKLKNALEEWQEETNASWTKEHMTSNVFGCPDLWFQTHKGGPMSITMCITETCRGEQVSDREGSHPQTRFSLPYRHVRHFIDKTWCWGNTDVMITVVSFFVNDFDNERCRKKPLDDGC